MDSSEGEPLLRDSGRPSRAYSAGSVNSLREDFYSGRRGSARSAASLRRHSEDEGETQEEDDSPGRRSSVI